MAWFNLFSGPTAEKLEKNGDALAAAGLWGQAKLEYERAYRKREASSDQDRESLKRLAGKIAGAREALAREHHQNGLQLAASGLHADALELVKLALELTADATLKATLTQQQRVIEADLAGAGHHIRSEPEDEGAPDKENEDAQAPDEQFDALCGTLPDAVREAYLGYGADFKTGYIALNNGDFETAARHLARALEAQQAPDSYIPLELATAYLHLDQPEQATQLLETLLEHHPDALPAYQILCEIYWEQGAFDRTEALLASIPAELAPSLAVFVLKGETLFQPGRLDDAKSLYGDFLATYGWDDTIARALARTHEALNEMDHARRIYQEIMGRCRSCHSRIDPLVKEKVADLSFAAGVQDTAILELCLSLAQELPENAPVYFTKVSRIYQTLGNQTEARRFLALAETMERK